MLYLLDRDVGTVKWNGIPLHEADSAVVKETLNGDFVLVVRYPITDSGIYQLIKEDMLIKAPVPVLGPQLFRIKNPVENDDSLDITAYHISDDVMYRSIRPMSIDRQACGVALSQMVQNAKTDLGNFSFVSDIMDSHTFNTEDSETLYSILLDGKHSIVGTWEGELVRDNFALSIKRSRGTDRGVIITTHKNLKAYQRSKNSGNVVTRIHARSTFRAEGAETDTVLTVTVDSPLISSYPYINEKEYENNNAKSVDELRKWAEAKFKNEGIDKVSDAIEIEAYELDGQVVHLGDTVNIKSRKHNVDIYKKAIAYEFDCLANDGKGEYISIAFDDKAGVGGPGASSGISSVAEAILGVSQNAQDVAIERATRNANDAFDAEFEKRVEVINDDIEQAQANAEAHADNIKQAILNQISESDRQYQLAQQAQDQQIAESLRVAGASTSLANTAKTLAEQAKVDLNLTKQSLGSQIAQVSNQASQFFDASREETARQVSALRLAVTQEYVAKSVFEENARGISQRFESLYVGGTNLLTGTDEHTEIFNSEQGRAEFLRTPYDLGEVFDKYGMVEYTLSFDLKASKTGAVHVYQQNGSDSRYAGLGHDVLATTEWQRFKITFRPVLGNPAIKESYLAFYGIYGTGVKPIVRRVKIERGTIGTDWSPAPEDATNYADTKIAEYKNTVDGRFATIQTSVDSKANLVDFQRVQETARLYERIIGTSESEVNSNLARQVLTSNLWQTEITLLPRAGGKNYFLNSNFKEGLKFWENNFPSPDLNIDPQLASQVKRTGILHVDTGDRGTFAHGFYQIVNMPISANEQITLSFDVAALPNNDAGLIIIINNHLFDVRKDISASEIPKTNTFGPTSLTRKSVTLSIPQDCASVYCIVIFGQGTIGNMIFADMQIEKGGAASDYRPNPADTNREVEAVTTRVDHLAGSWAVQHLNQAGDILSQANLSSAQFLLEATKIRLKGKTLADEIQAIDGKFGTLFVADGTFTKLNANVIGSQVITADKLKVDQAFFNKLIANDAYLKQLFAKSAFITQVQAVTLSASKISGGILKATNGAMQVNLNAGQIMYYTDQAALKRVLTGYPTQFVKFATGTVTGKGNAGVTVIGSNRWNSESSNDGGFVGIRAWNGANIDQIDVVGDTVRLASSTFESADGWTVNTLPGKLDIDAFNSSDRPSSRLSIGDVKLFRTSTSYVSLMDVLHQFNHNFKHLQNITGRGDVILTWDTIK
ncbi:hypothetical protein DAT299_04780 [Streptococcus suis]|uniref:phage tail spike protein n=1 Tax=Streptococcus suis TaxID=1307 RepID=UPI00161B053B|nr:phage tail spike protein [Streptococcus suis]BCK42914.1 hypothetical protein DAT299_04780 [Streptococcus suis]